jgi:hypothetical protein
MLTVLFPRCSEDERINDTSTPEIGMEETMLHTQQGESIIISGTASDPISLASINIYNEDWFLDKTIDLDEDSVITDYTLSYTFEVPDTSDYEEELLITVTNIGGVTNSATLKVVMDGDFEAPEIINDSEVSDGSTIMPEEGDVFDLDFTFTDNVKLGYVTIKESNLGLCDSIYEFSNEKLFNYTNDTISVPLAATDYSFKLNCVDSAGNSTSLTIDVTASYSTNYDTMYIADVETAAELNSDLFGVPMLINKTDDYTYEASYFCEEANTKVRFIPQTTSFSPVCFGGDPDDDTKLINSSDADGITLSARGYYKITINTEDLSYTVETFDPTTEDDAPDVYVVNNGSDVEDADYIGVLGLIGTGFSNCPDMSWSPSAIASYDELQLEQDETYVYHWSTTVTVSGNVQFIIGPEHQSDWWPEPYWRFDRQNDPLKTKLNSGNNVDMDVDSETTFEFIFDQYLNRAKMIKVE